MKLPQLALSERMIKLCMLLSVTLLATLAGVSSFVLDVPGYAKLDGTQARSWPSKRTYYSFRDVPYAEMPSNETRFLVIL